MHKKLTVSFLAALVVLALVALPASAQMYLTPLVSATTFDPFLSIIAANWPFLLVSAVAITGFMAAINLVIGWLQGLRRLKIRKV